MFGAEYPINAPISCELGLFTCSLETSFDIEPLKDTLSDLEIVNNSASVAKPGGGVLNTFSIESTKSSNEHSICLSLVKKSLPIN